MYGNFDTEDIQTVGDARDVLDNLVDEYIEVKNLKKFGRQKQNVKKRLTAIKANFSKLLDLVAVYSIRYANYKQSYLSIVKECDMYLEKLNSFDDIKADVTDKLQTWAS